MIKKKREKKKHHIPSRINIFFFLVFLMFSILILSLGITQIVEGENYNEQLANQSNNIVSQSVPRGIIFDRNNNVIVGNSPERAITFTRSSSQSREDVLEVAEALANFIEVDTSNVRERDKKDFWMLRNSEETDELVSDEEQSEIRAAGEEEDKTTREINNAIYQLQLERITQEMLAQLTEHDLQVMTIFNKMLGGTRGTPQTIKSGSTTRSGENYVTDEEFARVTEHIKELPGVQTKMDWQRTYPFESTLRTVLGNISTSSEGLPSDRIDHFLARGYNRNDRVGTSYIEKVFEDLLRGSPRQLEVDTDDNGNIIGSTIVSEGARGSDLALTLNMELQQTVEEIVEDELRSIRSSNPEADRAFVVMMDPQTGEVLALVGKQLVENEETGEMEMRDFALGTFTTNYAVGSAIKGATLLMAWESGATVPGQIFHDAPMQFRGTPVMSSWVPGGMGNIDDLYALARSSNVYMWRSIMAMGGATYVPGGPLRLSPDIFDDIRYYFSQFGLGVPTGIDLPNESAGQIGQGTLMGSALHMGIGQYDTYTPLQLAQFISTIANGGYRMQPQILKEVREPSSDGTGRIIQEMSPTVLNRINAEDEWIERIQLGHWQVMHRPGVGTAVGTFSGAPYNPAGKTGTAEVRQNGRDLHNQTLVAYAPFGDNDTPEVAISVVVPFMEPRSGSSSQAIGRAVLDAYFGLQQNTSETDGSDDDD